MDAEESAAPREIPSDEMAADEMDDYDDCPPSCSQRNSENGEGSAVEDSPMITAENSQESADQQLALVLERRQARKVQEQQEHEEHQKVKPLWGPPTIAALRAREGKPPRPPPMNVEVEPDPTIITITLEGRVDAPGRIGTEAFKDALAAQMRMERQHFTVKKVIRGESRYIIPPGGVHITVDVDEDAFGEYRVEKKYTEVPYDRKEGLPEPDKSIAEGLLTEGITKGLLPVLPDRSYAFEIRWTECS